LKERQTEYTKPVKEHLDGIVQTFAAVTVPLDQADKITRDKILKYNADQEKRRREAEEINRMREEATRREAALNDGEITDTRPPIEVPKTAPRIVRTDVGNAGIVKTRKYRILDFAKLPDTYKLENSVLLNKVTRAGIPEIPGVEFYFEEGLRVTTK
jgi:hypothetical protein